MLFPLCFLFAEVFISNPSLFFISLAFLMFYLSLCN